MERIVEAGNSPGVVLKLEFPTFATDSNMKKSAQKTRSVWGQIYNVTIGNLLKIVSIIRSAIGAVVSNVFFFPLKCSLIANNRAIHRQLQIEERYYKDFWDPEKPLDPGLRLHGEIREKFAPPEDWTFSIDLKNGKRVEMTCRIIQTKQIEDSSDHFYNFAQVPGIFTTNSNNIGTTYPYLAAYLNQYQGAESLPPARFLMISENHLNCKPDSLEEAGLILWETLKALRGKFGEIDQVVAHSLGVVFLANALKQVDDPKLLPKHICFDRGPTSIWQVSKKIFFGFGRLIYLLAKCGRWTANVEQNIADFCHKWEERPPLLITGVIQDHHFSGSANLCLGKKVKKIEGVKCLAFDPPRQLVHEHAHHNLRPDLLNARYLTVQDSTFMDPSENLAEVIIRHSRPLPDMQQQIA